MQTKDYRILWYYPLYTYRSQMLNHKKVEFIYHRHASFHQPTGEPTTVKKRHCDSGLLVSTIAKICKSKT